MAGVDDTKRLVVEIDRRGKLISGEPYFTAGPPIVLDTKGFGGPRARATSRSSGRAGAGARRASDSARRSRIENVLEALLVERAHGSEFEPYELPAETLEGRVDLRDLPTMTIDPDGARTSTTRSRSAASRDGIRAWVHIADVSWFVRAGTAARPGRRGARVLDVRARASSRRCCRTSSPTTPARSGRSRTGSA